ncbi:hypothetical protein BIWAKO_00009 [Bosea sp. BIWAKO-01]|nr:hypothetical protein BIWAKO_00009 [Bosea sp. BIWAKO-01]
MRKPEAAEDAPHEIGRFPHVAGRIDAPDAQEILEKSEEFVPPVINDLAECGLQAFGAG